MLMSKILSIICLVGVLVLSLAYIGFAILLEFCDCGYGGGCELGDLDIQEK